MGGFNSGRRGGKDCTGDKLALDVRRLQRDGLLKPGLSFGWTWTRRGEKVGNIDIRTDTVCVILDYRQRSHGGEWQAMKCPVRLTWTPCHYGGQRAWWLCPAARCGRRVAVLYGGAVFACRHCHRLAYRCQREAPDDRATRRADKLRDRLGWEAGILNGEGGKPKGMHWTTYWRMKASHDAHVHRAFAGMAAKLGISMQRLHGVNQMLDAIEDQM